MPTKIKFNELDHVNCNGFCVDEKSLVRLNPMKRQLLKTFDTYNSKIIWCRIPKTASVSIANFLGWNQNAWDHYQVKFMIDQIGVEKYNNAFKFAFVRNPLARLTSIFEYFRVHPGWRSGAICIQNFDQWVLMGCPHNIGRLDERQADGAEIAPGKNILLQKSQLVDKYGNVNFDFIGRVENITQDAAQLKNILFDLDPPCTTGRAWPTSQVMHLNAGTVGIPAHEAPAGDERGIATKADWRLYYSIPEVLRKAQDILKEDLDLFNY